jgi:hypothetical protein
MAAIDQPSGPAVTIRDAAAACRLSPRTIRRKVSEGAFPNAYKAGEDDAEPSGIWMIPVGDLEAAGLNPTLVHPTLTQAGRGEKHAEDDGPTVLELVRSDRFGRLRAELAEAVAAAEISLLRAEAERWRTVADERAAALDRADTALRALTTALSAGQLSPPVAPRSSVPPPSVPAPAPVAAPPLPAVAPGPTAAPGPTSDIVAVPPLVRAEAMRYTATLQALHELRRQQNRWWQFWK